MPYSFTKIEKDKSNTIAFVFSFLIIFYFASIWLISLIVKNYFAANSTSGARQYYTFQWLGIVDTLIILMIALAVGIGHWYFSTRNIIPKIINILGAQEPDPNDRYHQMYQNIVEEVSVATGGTPMIAAVVPTMAMNAFALADFEGRALIGITEGMLSRLTRDQIEAVVGHEAAHIVSGDCLSTTVTSSLFELYGGALKAMQLMLGGGRYTHRRSRGGNNAVALILLIYLMLLITNFLAQLVRMFISREREYRADAIAVRLTRNPLALAEALYAIGFHWRGAGLAAEELEAIFIMNPKYAAADESETTFANLYSTHPPMIKRIDILLNMAHSDIETLQKEVERKSKKVRTEVPGKSDEEPEWMVNRDGKWEGPFPLTQIASFDWIRPDTWIQPMDRNEVIMARDDQRLASMAVNSSEQMSQHDCPRCRLPLRSVDYEGCPVLKCQFCQGTLVSEQDVQKIILRQEVGFDERIKRIAEKMQSEEQAIEYNRIPKDPNSLLDCPNCVKDRRKMLRQFYTMAYRVEVDRCMKCKNFWFDRDELEVLQYLIELSHNKK